MSVVVTAHSKLTLSLRVLGARPDGFHEIEALAVSLSAPADTCAVERAPRVTCAVSGPAAAGVPTDERNLAVRAARRLLPGTAAVALALVKAIPAGAGLGGGSADAAATLVAVRDLFEIAATDDDLEAVAAELGSDVPFCVRGGAAWMRGRGERIEPVPAPSAFPVLVAVPPFRCSTPAVYAAWDELGGPAGGRTVPAPAAIAGLTEGLANDLEEAAERVEPRLSGFRARLEEAAGRPALLAGSGSAHVVCFDDLATAADALADAERALPEAMVVLGETTAEGVAR